MVKRIALEKNLIWHYFQQTTGYEPLYTFTMLELFENIRTTTNHRIKPQLTKNIFQQKSRLCQIYRDTESI